MKNIKFGSLYVLSILLMCSACKKDWLDAKPNKALVVPIKIADYQALLDNSGMMNIQAPTISMVGDGDYFVKDATYNSLSSPAEKGAYLWLATADFYNGQECADWTVAYERILRDNVVLDGLQALSSDQVYTDAYKNVKGSALFYRSFDYYNLSQQFCRVYNVTTSMTDLGLPLRVSSNVNITLSRSTLQQTYDLIINDLLQASQLLPAKPLFPTRPSKAAAFGLLSRIFISQENYGKALLYADSCLQLQDALLNYNELSTTASSPIGLFNKEVIFHAQLFNYISSVIANCNISPDLYQSYTSGDLRKDVFFFTNVGNMAFRGNYTGARTRFFGGLATDEIYLNRAECYARTGKVDAAMRDINILLKTRWKTGTYVNKTASTVDEALNIIIPERRKELCFRNLRWPDLRRLNKDSRFQYTLTRIMNGQTYTLAPNSSRYVLPLDPIETTLGGLEQNPRN